jgi:hypothetical protein
MRQLAVAALAATTLIVSEAATAQPSCDRACLTQVLDGYLAAVIRHQPAQAPLAANYRGTENAVEVKPGDGVWRTATGLGAVQRRYLDPQSGQAAYYGLLEEAPNQAAVVTLRVKVTGRKISEAEWFIARRGEALYSPAGLAAEPPLDSKTPPARRASREALIKAADSYFEGLQRGDGKVVIHNPGCVRLENGTKVTQRQPPPGASAEERAEFASVDCAGGLDRFDIRAVAHRRFPVVDVEQQAVVGIGMFLRKPGSTRQRLLLSEVFTAEGGRIQQIHAAMKYIPAEAPETTGW